MMGLADLGKSPHSISTIWWRHCLLNFKEASRDVASKILIGR